MQFAVYPLHLGSGSSGIRGIGRTGLLGCLIGAAKMACDKQKETILTDCVDEFIHVIKSVKEYATLIIHGIVFIVKKRILLILISASKRN